MWRAKDSTKYTDVYISMLTIPLSKVYTSPGNNYSTAFQVDGNGPYSVMAWVDQASASDTRLVPWFSFNTNLYFIPMVSK